MVGWREQRGNFPTERFGSEQKDKEKLVHERQKQEMKDKEKEYVSERTVPSENETTGPSESSLEEK